MSTGAHQRLEEFKEVTLAKRERVAAHFETSVPALYAYSVELNNARGSSERVTRDGFMLGENVCPSHKE